MKPDPSIEERERLAASLIHKADLGVVCKTPAYDAELRRAAALLRAPTRAPEEGTRIEGWAATCIDQDDNVGYDFYPDPPFHEPRLDRATLILHASVTVDGEVTE